MEDEEAQVVAVRRPLFISAPRQRNAVEHHYMMALAREAKLKKFNAKQDNFMLSMVENVIDTLQCEHMMKAGAHLCIKRRTKKNSAGKVL